MSGFSGDTRVYVAYGDSVSAVMLENIEVGDEVLGESGFSSVARVRKFDDRSRAFALVMSPGYMIVATEKAEVMAQVGGEGAFEMRPVGSIGVGDKVLGMCLEATVTRKMELPSLRKAYAIRLSDGRNLLTPLGLVLQAR